MVTKVPLLSTILYVSTIHAHPADVQARDDQSIQYGVIGDSYASGVTYGLLGHNNYDDNKDGCMRVNHAYGVQLEDFPPTLGGKGTLNFAACSGARLGDMVKGKMQMDSLPSNLNFLTMQAGGNDAGFFGVASDCIFHQASKEYGSGYPSPGPCVDSINAVQSYITDIPVVGHLGYDMDRTIRDVLGHPSTQQNPKFKLYVIGYAHFFNTDPDDSNWCNKASFSVSVSERLKGTQPKLTLDLRERINSLTTDLNALIELTVTHLNDPRVEYVSITEGFEKHRFCEKGKSWSDQYLSDDVWFWNASPEGLWAKQDLWDGGYEHDWSEAYDPDTTFNQTMAEAFNWSDLLATEKGANAQEPYVGWTSGSALRPFHPKEPGHGAIKDAIKNKIVLDSALCSLQGLVPIPGCPQ